MTTTRIRPKVMITGVAGYIGSHTALAFLDAGWEVVGVDDLSVGRRSAVPDGVMFHEIDCASPDIVTIATRQSVQAAVHFAGKISVEESVAKPLDYYDANLTKAGKFFRSVTRAGVKGIVFSSTAAVYGDTGLSAVDETTATVPSSPYGRSKLATEWMLQDHCAVSDPSYVILRYFNVAGVDSQLRAGPSTGASHLIKIVAEAATGQRDNVVIYGDDNDTRDGTCVRDYIHVSDLADAHVAAVQYLLDGHDSITLNCGYGLGSSVREVIEYAKRYSPCTFTTSVGPPRAGDLVSVVADSTLLRSKFKWQPKHDDLGKILKSSIDWERAQLGSRPDKNRAGT